MKDRTRRAIREKCIHIADAIDGGKIEKAVRNATRLFYLKTEKELRSGEG